MCRPTHEPTTSHNITTVNKITMMEIIPVTYTSLSDLITVRDITLPSRVGSEHNITIKDPLVKQAALAYLSPQSTPPDIVPRWLERRCSCVEIVSDVVFGRIKRAMCRVFGARRRFGCEEIDGLLRDHGNSQRSMISSGVSYLSLELYEEFY
ncbi:hypothetical protein RND81_09G148800 [Saponaria officinalis]|uniref:Uncharacterized protein n=1 Tax=Saponaria officinalis TaxID=3572 RepID=A0AAW1IMQ7_SAPOF